MTEPVGGRTTEQRFTAAGQLYGLGDEGFMHASSPRDYGNFFSTAGVLVAGQAVPYTPVVGFNLCQGGRAVADLATIDSYPVPGAPISRTSLESLTPSTGTLSPAFVSGTTSYTLTVPAGSAARSVTVVPAEPGAEITATVGGNPAAITGGTLGPVTGPTVITITVTASSGERRTYTITVANADAENPAPETPTTPGTPTPTERTTLSDTGAAETWGIGMLALGLLAAGFALLTRPRRS